MREFEFRAWNKYFEQYHEETHRLMIRLDGKIYNSEYGDTQCDRFIIEQYTGLKDVNGVKIFEGDIVRDSVGIGVVEYSEIKAAFKVNYKDGFCKWFIDYILKGERESIEVIGNIHQNHELLGKQK